MTDVRKEVQRKVLDGELYREVTETEEKLRSSSEYDLRDADERRFAILCWAIEQSAQGTVGTCTTLNGIRLALRKLRQEGEVG